MPGIGDALKQAKGMMDFTGEGSKLDNFAKAYPTVTLVAMAILGPIGMLGMFITAGGMPSQLGAVYSLGGSARNLTMALTIGAPIALVGLGAVYGLHKMDKNGKPFKVLRWPLGLIICASAIVVTMLVSTQLGDQVFSTYQRSPKGLVIPVPPELRFSMLNTVLVISAKGITGLVDRITEKSKYRQEILTVLKWVGMASMIASMTMLTMALVQGTGETPQMALTRKGVAITLGAIVCGAAGLLTLILEIWMKATSKARVQWCSDTERSASRRAENVATLQKAAHS